MGSWHPCSVHETEIWRIFMAPKDAPDEVKDVLRHYVIRYQGPSGLTEQDDMENWGSAHEGARGTIARRFDYHYGMGMGYEQRAWPAEWLGGDVYATTPGNVVVTAGRDIAFESCTFQHLGAYAG